jgi:CHAD domain-containing protein
MKGLQDYLGAYQDYAVQQNRLNELDLQMAAEGSLPPETHEALALLVERLRRHQHQIRGEFNDRFRTFSHGRSRRGFLRLYAPKEMTA